MRIALNSKCEGCKHRGTYMCTKGGSTCINNNKYTARESLNKSK